MDSFDLLVKQALEKFDGSKIVYEERAEASVGQDAPAGRKGALGAPADGRGGRPADRRRACLKAHISALNFHLVGSGTVVELKVSGLQSRPKGRGGKRSKIRAFSPASRRRLLFRVCEIEWQSIPIEEIFALTLTYHEIPKDGSRVKRDLDNFRRRLDRLFDNDYGLIWKLEFQARGSAHFQLILRASKVPEKWLEWHKGARLDNDLFLLKLREFVSASWNEIAAPGDEEHLLAGTNVGRPHTNRQIALYLAKYMAKGEEGFKSYQHIVPSGYEDLGRWWGFIHRDAFPRDFRSMQLTEDEFYRARRTIRRYARAKSRGRWKPKEYSRYSGIKVLCGVDDNTVLKRLMLMFRKE